MYRVILKYNKMSIIYYKACHVTWPKYYGHDKQDCSYCMEYHLLKGTHVKDKQPLNDQAISATHQTIHRYGLLWSSTTHVHWMDQGLTSCWKKGFQLALLRRFTSSTHTLPPEKLLVEQECFSLAKGLKKDDHFFFWICDTELLSQTDWMNIWCLFPKECTLWIIMEDLPKLPWAYSFQDMSYSEHNNASQVKCSSRVVVLYRRHSTIPITPLLLEIWEKRRCRAHLKHLSTDIVCHSNRPFHPSQLFFGFR